MSAFATIVGRLGELSESELRQLHLIVGVRLGFPDGTATTKSGAPSKKGKGAGGKTSKNPGKKGNPSRKSQWANNPLYREYSRLKKAVEAQAKEFKTPFAEVDTAESSAYKLALNQWLEAKSSFRGHKKTTEEAAGGTPAEGKTGAETALDDDGSSDESDDDQSPGPGPSQPATSPPGAQSGGKGKAPATSRGRGRGKAPAS